MPLCEGELVRSFGLATRRAKGKRLFSDGIGIQSYGGVRDPGPLPERKPFVVCFGPVQV